MKDYELVIRTGEGDEVGVWRFSVTEKGKLHYLPGGRPIKDAIKEYEEGENAI